MPPQNPTIDPNKPNPTAVLVSVQVQGVSDEDNAASLAELGRLVKTLGFEVVGQLSQKRKTPASNTIVGEGKLREIAEFTGGKGFVEGFKGKKKFTDSDDDLRFTNTENLDQGDHDDESDEDSNSEIKAEKTAKPHASVVVFDNEITPTQLRNLEEATEVEVLDRTGVILEIFSRHARSREARLQVEIAKLNYSAPRLRASNVGSDRQGGGIGAKGAGETAHELDRRRIRDRIAELRGQLDTIRAEQENRRSKRQEANSVALVGYTNAGKSSLMRALTGSDVLIADKLFATLDTTVRALQPETMPRILVSDTVGFIKKLPHDLVASFRSTLDEALGASILLYTVDAADPTFRSQLEVTKTVLAEIGATETPSKLILNKIDCLKEDEIESLRQEFPDAIFISTRNPNDIKKMHDLIVGFFEESMTDEVLVVPYTKGKYLGDIRGLVRVISETYDEEGTLVTVRGSKEDLTRLRKLLSQ